MNQVSIAIESARPGLSSFIQPSGRVESYDQGRLMSVRRVKLDDGTEERRSRIKMRAKTTIELHSTIYGRAHQVRAGVINHSPSGLNHQMINAYGMPDVEKVQRYFRNTIQDDQAKMSRINRITTQFVATDTYENYTALFFSMRSLAWTLECTERCTTVMKTFRVPEVLLAPMERQLTEADYWFRAGQIMQGQCGYTAAYGFQPFGDLSAGALNAIVPRKKDGARFVQARVWVCPEYIDGHSTITSRRYREAGFVNRHYLYNEICKSNIIDPDLLVGSTNAMPDKTAEAAELYFAHQYFVRGEGLTAKDIWVLAQCIYARRRHTPFLCDQNVDLGKESERTLFVGIDTESVREMLEYAQGSELGPGLVPPCMSYTYDDVMDTLYKFVAIHRCYDDSVLAMNLFDNYVAQPLSTTVEGHIYFNIPWITDLPKLGMRRAAVAIMLADQPALIAPSAYDTHHSFTGITRVQTSISVAVNHLWYWGEYLYIAGRLNWDQTINELTRGKAHDMQVDRWQASVISAMVGQKQPTSPFYGVGTRFRYSFDKCFGAPRIEMDNIPDSRELNMTSDGIMAQGIHCRIFKYTVPPPNAGFIIGLDGTLLTNTPYGARFTITKPRTQLGRNNLVKRVSRANAWALGVSGRWNGYDVKYSDGSVQRRSEALVMFAANEDSIAPPPVFDPDVEMLNEHAIYGTIEREHVFGELPTDSLEEDGQREFIWNNDKIGLMAEFSRRSYESVSLGATGRRSQALMARVQFDKEFLLAVNAEYQPESADFRLEQVMAGLVPDQGQQNPDPMEQEGGLDAHAEAEAQEDEEDAE